MDLLPSKSSAHQTTIANDAQLLGRPKYLNDRPEGRSNLRPEGLAKEEQRSLPTPARLSDRKAWPNTAFDSDPRLRQEMHRTHAYSSSPTALSN